MLEIASHSNADIPLNFGSLFLQVGRESASCEVFSFTFNDDGGPVVGVESMIFSGEDDSGSLVAEAVVGLGELAVSQ